MKGENKNGGIERFKIEKHGRGLPESDLVAFIRNKNFDYWLENVNIWVTELEGTGFPSWKKDEALYK